MNAFVSTFKFSQADLAQLGIEAVRLWDRDQAEFLVYGKDQAWRDALKAKVNAYSDLPRNSEMSADIVLATENKNMAREDTTKRVRTILTKAKSTFGRKGSKYLLFAPCPMSTFSDTRFISYAKIVHHAATTYLAEMAAQGLTQQEVDALKISINLFDTSIIHKNNAVQDRDVATSDRIEMGNELYREISILYEYGRDVWRYSNEAKYNDYVIYTTAKRAS